MKNIIAISCIETPAFEYLMLAEKISATTAMLIVWPILRIVPIVADATPYIDLSTQLIIAFALGDENNPVPIPVSESVSIGIIEGQRCR